MANQELVDTLERIDRKLSAILAVAVARLQNEDDSLAASHHTSIDSILDAAGLKGAEIAALLGKTPQAVSYQLAQAKKAKGKGK